MVSLASLNSVGANMHVLEIFFQHMHVIPAVLHINVPFSKACLGFVQDEHLQALSGFQCHITYIHICVGIY